MCGSAVILPVFFIAVLFSLPSCMLVSVRLYIMDIIEMCGSALLLPVFVMTVLSSVDHAWIVTSDCFLQLA